MRSPLIRATIERRILVNYQVDLEALAEWLPAPFEPMVVHGYGVAGICLIRLGDVRPAGVPARLGPSAENAAHRVAVQWDTAHGPVTGVYIPRRDTSSRIVAALGGRAFPGWQHRADFEVEEEAGRYRVAMASRDGAVRAGVVARVAHDVMAGSLFPTLDEASTFFREAPKAYAATPRDGVFDGVALEAGGWGLQPLHVEEAYSSLFDGFRSAVLDSAFLMEGLDTHWRSQPKLTTTGSGRG